MGASTALGSIINWGVLLSFLMASLGIGVASGRNVTSTEDLFIGRRQTPWWAIGVSILASYVSALSFLGGPAWSYDAGLSALSIHLNYPIVIFFVVTFFLPFFYGARVPSIYAYLEERFGQRTRTLMSLLFIVTQTLTSATLLAATASVVAFLTGWPALICLAIVAVFAIGYTLYGGITAVIWTDVLQAAILIIGALVIGIALVAAFADDGRNSLELLKAEGRTNAIDFSVDFTKVTTIWAGVIAMSLYHTTVYGANQMIVQRALAARSLSDARKSFLITGYGAALIYGLFMGIGILLYAFFDGREFEDPNLIILIFSETIGIPGLMGLLASAVLAASLSTLDSAINSLTTVTTVDFLDREKAHDDPITSLSMTRWLTIFWGLVIAVPGAIFLAQEGSVLELVGKIGSYFIGAKLAIYGLGFFSKRITERPLLLGVAAGFVAVFACDRLTDIAWPWFVVVGASANILAAYIASMFVSELPITWHPLTVIARRREALHDPQRLADAPGTLTPGTLGLLAAFAAMLVGLMLFHAWI